MRTKSEMYPIVERWLVSPITKEGFCRQEGLPLHVLSYWVSRYNRKRGETGSAQGFVPLEVTGIANHRSVYLEVTLPTGSRVSFHQRPSEGELALILSKC